MRTEPRPVDALAPPTADRVARLREAAARVVWLYRYHPGSSSYLVAMRELHDAVEALNRADADRSA